MGSFLLPSLGGFVLAERRLPALIIMYWHGKLSYHTFNELNSLILTEFPFPVIHTLHLDTSPIGVCQRPLLEAKRWIS